MIFFASGKFFSSAAQHLLHQRLPVARRRQTLQPLEQAREMELRREAESLGALLHAQTVLQQEALGRFEF